jgi:hypothetical protein
MDEPIRTFFDRAGPHLEVPDPDAIGRELAALAGDGDYAAHLVSRLDGGTTGGLALHAPERGPRLLFVHRPEGVMSWTHSHSVWVALAPVRGLETHRRYEVRDLSPQADGPAHLEMAEERRLGHGDVIMMIPPDDVHSHGHERGHGLPPYTLILSGDDQFRYERTEYDLVARTRRTLAPGDRGSGDLPPT